MRFHTPTERNCSMLVNRDVNFVFNNPCISIDAERDKPALIELGVHKSVYGAALSVLAVIAVDANESDNCASPIFIVDNMRDVAPHIFIS